MIWQMPLHRIAPIALVFTLSACGTAPVPTPSSQVLQVEVPPQVQSQLQPALVQQATPQVTRHRETCDWQNEEHYRESRADVLLCNVLQTPDPRCTTIGDEPIIIGIHHAGKLAWAATGHAIYRYQGRAWHKDFEYPSEMYPHDFLVDELGIAVLTNSAVLDRAADGHWTLDAFPISRTNYNTAFGSLSRDGNALVMHGSETWRRIDSHWTLDGPPELTPTVLAQPLTNGYFKNVIAVSANEILWLSAYSENERQIWALWHWDPEHGATEWVRLPRTELDPRDAWIAEQSGEKYYVVDVDNDLIIISLRTHNLRKLVGARTSNTQRTYVVGKSLYREIAENERFRVARIDLETGADIPTGLESSTDRVYVYVNGDVAWSADTGNQPQLRRFVRGQQTLQVPVWSYFVHVDENQIYFKSAYNDEFSRIAIDGSTPPERIATNLRQQHSSESGGLHFTNLGNMWTIANRGVQFLDASGTCEEFARIAPSAFHAGGPIAIYEGLPDGSTRIFVLGQTAILMNEVRP